MEDKSFDLDLSGVFAGVHRVDVDADVEWLEELY